MVAGAVISSNPLKLDYQSHRKCLAICAVITVSSFQYGLDYALVGGFMAMPGFLRVFGYFDETTQKWAIDTTVQQLISSLMTVGTLVGSLLIGPFSQRFGRKNGLWTASALNAISTGIMMGTTTVGPLYFARFLLGMNLHPARDSCPFPDKCGFEKAYPWVGSSPLARSTLTKQRLHTCVALSLPSTRPSSAWVRL